MAIQHPPYKGLRELALFAGAGGGILGGKLLNWQTVCAVEINQYAASILCARQNDGILPPFPIWDNVSTFNGKSWRGLVDVVSGGFPCQDISTAGKGHGIKGERSGLWKEFSRIISEIRPQFAFIENSPALSNRGLDIVLSDLASIRYDAEWLCLSAQDCGAPHKRDRLWILAHNLCATSNPDCKRCDNGQYNWQERQIHSNKNRNPSQNKSKRPQFKCWPCEACENIPNTNPFHEQGQQQSKLKKTERQKPGERSSRSQNNVNGWWASEPDVGRVADGLAFRVDRLKAIGNGQVPVVAATAFKLLYDRLIKNI